VRLAVGDQVALEAPADEAFAVPATRAEIAGLQAMSGGEAQ
jgi:hypothetical protein